MNTESFISFFGRAALTYTWLEINRIFFSLVVATLTTKSIPAAAHINQCDTCSRFLDVASKSMKMVQNGVCWASNLLAKKEEKEFEF